MEAIQDFEDMLALLNKYQTQYLIIGRLAFIYHAKPRYTKDIKIISPYPVYLPIPFSYTLLCVLVTE